MAESSTETGGPIGNSYATCPDNLTTGPHVEVLYGVPSDLTTDPDVEGYSAWLDPMRKSLGDVDQYLDWSAGPYRDQNVRWLCSGGVVTIKTVNLLPLNKSNETDNKYTFEDVTSSLQNSTLNSPTYEDSSRHYLVMVDGLTTSRYGYGGQGTIALDGSVNTSNQHPSNGLAYAMVPLRTLTENTAHYVMHELFHTFGGVQYNAPHSTAKDYRTGVVPAGAEGGHCYEMRDPMCGSKPFETWAQTGGPVLENVCDGDSFSKLDCNKDDYYSTLCVVNPVKCQSDGNFLYNHWNTARSPYLTVPATANAGVNCGATSVTVNLDEGRDTFNGSSPNDVVQGLEGNDTLSGYGGDDRVCGEGGHDSLGGGVGADRLYGGGGEDTLRGGDGNDYLSASFSNDIIYDGMGVDQIDGGYGWDILYQCADGVQDTISSDVEDVRPPSSSSC